METEKRCKLIHKTYGAASEYAKWACDIYYGCSNRCEYCSNKNSLGKWVLGKDRPIIKGGGMTFNEAYDLFRDELKEHKDYIVKDGGLFFGLVSDPCLPETSTLNLKCIEYCILHRVPVIVLTKQTDWVYDTDDWGKLLLMIVDFGIEDYFKIGFTLTGMDELEPGASHNERRIEALADLYELEFLTFVNMDPIIDPSKSYELLKRTEPFCEEFRFNLNSMKKHNTEQDIVDFKSKVEASNDYKRKLLWNEPVQLLPIRNLK